MMKKIQYGSSFVGFVWTLLFQLFMLVHLSFVSGRSPNRLINEQAPFPPVILRKVDQEHVTVDNGIIKVTFSTSGGMVTGLQYNEIDNLLQTENKEDERGYWDVVWSQPKQKENVTFDKLGNTSFQVIVQNENQVELSFSRAWDNGAGIPLNVDKRYVVLRCSSGFYTYAIFERFKGFPASTLYQGRVVCKLQGKLFQFMAISDSKQRTMPAYADRTNGKELDYPEAVILTNPSNASLTGEVDDKYQYSTDNKDSRVHGWICSNPPTGFWVITPSNEFQTAGPVKQDLTSHTGPISLSMFFSTHYAGDSLGIQFEEGEPWKKVFGPIFMYVNSGSPGGSSLWEDAKKQLLTESGNWPYEFPLSQDYIRTSQRGTVSGRLQVEDDGKVIDATGAFVGLASPGVAGSWQSENKGYQFWAQQDSKGSFFLPNIRPGKYSLYAWVPGFIGDFKHNIDIEVSPGGKIDLGTLTYVPPRNGPTLWHIGTADRTAAEFFIPPPSENFINKLYVNLPEKWRQYGLWQRYTDLYPKDDLVFYVGKSDASKDWFFAHVNRNMGDNSYQSTTWKVVFDLQDITPNRNYTLQLALASSNEAELQVLINDGTKNPLFTTGVIGKDNAIARHGIHGLYWLYSVGIPSSQLVEGSNTIFLRQASSLSQWRGIMYDYIRLESPPSAGINKQRFKWLKKQKKKQKNHAKEAISKMRKKEEASSRKRRTEDASSRKSGRI